MIPFQKLAGGNCQDAVILVEDFAVRAKFSGACEGTAIEKNYIIQNHFSTRTTHFLQWVY